MKARLIVLSVLFGWVAPLAAQDIPLSKILVDKEGWREVAKDFREITLLEAESAGTIAIYQQFLSGRIGEGGKVEKVSGQQLPKLPTDVTTRAGRSYRIQQKSIIPTTISTDKFPRASLNLLGLTEPTCLTLWPDEGHLVIGAADGAYLWVVRIEADGSFGPGDRYYSLRTEPGKPLRVAAMTMDAGHMLFACTPLGIQVFDPTGRLSGVIAAPSKEAMTAIAIGGPQADELFVAAGDRIFARKIQGKASYTMKKTK
jgi:hypothetical protein